MANTDPNDKRPGGFSLVSWLNGIKAYFASGGSVLKPAGSSGATIPLPKTALFAKKAYADQKGGSDPSTLTRMELCARKLQMWNNDIDPLIDEKLRLAFHPDNYARMRLIKSKWTNVMRRVVEDISSLYEQPVIRKLVDKTQEYTLNSEPDAEAKAGIAPPKDPNAAPPKPPSIPKPPVKKSVQANKPPPGKTVPQGDGGSTLATGDPDVDALADILELSGAADETQETPYAKLLKCADLDAVLDVVEKLTRFLPCVWVRPYVRYGTIGKVETTDDTGNVNVELVGDPASAKLSYLIYTPDKADIVPDLDDPKCAEAFYYWGEEMNEQGEVKTVIHFYTNETYWKFDTDWRILDTAPSLYGRLPVTCFRSALPTSNYYLDGTGDDLYEATLETNILRTIQNARYKDSGFKQHVLMGVDPESVPADQVMGGPTPIYVPEGGSATVLDLQPELTQMTETVKLRTLDLVARYGISPSEYDNNSSPRESGFAKQLDRQKVLRINKTSRKFFVEAEKDLYRLTALTLQTHPIEGIGTLDPDAELQLDFAEPTYEEDPKTQAFIDAANIKMHIISVIDILRRENPDLNDVDLIKMMQKNKRINEVFMDSGQNALIDLLDKPGGGGAAGGGGSGGGFGSSGGGSGGEGPVL